MDATLSPPYYNNMNNNMIPTSHTEPPQPQYHWGKAGSSSFMTTNTLPPEHSQVAADQFQTQELQVKQVQESHVQQPIPGNGMDISTKPQQRLWQNHQQLPPQQTYSHDGFLTPAIELMPEPPPYEEFNIEWPGADMPLPPAQLEFGEATQLLNPDEENYIFSQFFDELDGNPEFLFNPELPPNMPPFMPQTNEPNNVESTHLTSFSSNVMLAGNNAFSLPEAANNTRQIIDNASNSTSLSPRTENLHLSNSPKEKNSQLPSPINETAMASSSTSTTTTSSSPSSNSRLVPAKRKQVEDDAKSSRRSSNPRLTINTKIGASKTNNVATSSRTGSPLTQLSNLSIENSTMNTAMNQNGVESSCNSNNNTPPPSPPGQNREMKAEAEESSIMNTSSLDIKSEMREDLDDDESGTNSASKSSRKPYKELLTEEEKRANHIASEQKRRNTIRAGFKELTDIIPTLKNVNNSKSTILFKAVDYIRYLERRNRNLKERSHLLEMRVEMQMRSGKGFHHHSGPYGPPISFGHQRVAPMPISNHYGMPGGVNGMGIPILAHAPPQQHVISGPQHVQNIFVNAPPQDNPQMMAFNSANLMSPTNNVFRHPNGSISIPAQVMDSKQLMPQGAMSIPADEHQMQTSIPPKDTEMTSGNGSIVVKS